MPLFPADVYPGSISLIVEMIQLQSTTLIIITRTAYKPCFNEYIFGDCPDHTCLCGCPIITVTAVC